MEVLGLPLLAHLAVRLMVQWPGDNLQPLVADPTALYRHLTDLTCAKGGRYGTDVHEPQMAHGELRRLLHEAAAAMTVFGRDHIPYDELDYRLSALDEDLIDRVREVTKDHPVTSLMISFFFKGGRKELGAEFLHKSFREYLFAECVVESLKTYRRVARAALAERDPYWKDFDPGDARFDFSRRLGRLLAPQWITKEVARYLHGLVQWELRRAHGGCPEPTVGAPTESLDLAGWECIRDGLADLWDWWGEGVHLRQQPRFRGKKLTEWESPFVAELIQWAMPQAPTSELNLVPPRSVAMDAHLGDGLCRLAALVHHYIAVPPDSEPEWQICSETPSPVGVRRYQSRGLINGQPKVRFRPSGQHSRYFMNYVARINASGWHPGFYFPSELFLGSVDFDETSLACAPLARARLAGASFVRSNLFLAALFNSDLRKADMRGATLRGSDMSNTSLEGVRLDGAYLDTTKLAHASCDQTPQKVAQFDNCNVEGSRGLNIQVRADQDRVSEGTEEGSPRDSDQDDAQ